MKNIDFDRVFDSDMILVIFKLFFIFGVVKETFCAHHSSLFLADLTFAVVELRYHGPYF